ncbi:MAG: ribbon-helix-helix protein, CopG family [Candidatus Lokiarchaeota archaeon]|nr:ribbon-helix-helix protein, CopG family [Candidatus Lokiarchaeota archaeon]
MQLISVNIPESYLKVLEMLVIDGKFPNRSEAIRIAIRDLIKTEFLIDETIKKSENSYIKIESEEIQQENLVF